MRRRVSIPAMPAIRGPQEGVEMLFGPPVRVSASELAHDHAPGKRPRGFVIGRRSPIVPDVGIGEGDDLAGIARIGQHLLVADEGGVEDDLARGDAGWWHRTEVLAFKYRAVGQDQRRADDASITQNRRANR